MKPALFILAAQVGAAESGPGPGLGSGRKILCLANKEALVLAGHVFRQSCARSGAVIPPVDSSTTPCSRHWSPGETQVSRLILTASGGPFRTKSLEEIQTATPAQALKHPNWSMGAKISIDSATMMNKGLKSSRLSIYTGSVWTR